MDHELKIWPQYFRDVWAGRKTFEIRMKERDYRCGDRLILKEFDVESGFTGNEIVAEIEYIFESKSFLQPGYMILGIKVLSRFAGAKFIREIDDGENTYSLFQCGWCRWRFVGDVAWCEVPNYTKHMEVPNFCPACGTRIGENVLTEAPKNAV